MALSAELDDVLADRSLLEAMGPDSAEALVLLDEVSDLLIGIGRTLVRAGIMESEFHQLIRPMRFPLTCAFPPAVL